MTKNITGLLRLSLLPLFVFAMAGFLVGFAAQGHAESDYGVKTGEAAPNFTLQGHDGESYSLDAYKGQIVVLEWTNNECPYVKKFYEEGDMQAVQKEATEDGVVWFTVLSSAKDKQGYMDAEAATLLIQEQGSHETARLLDPSGEVGKLYNAKTTPHMFVINPEGTLVYQGAIDSIPSVKHEDIAKADNYVEAALAAIAQGTKIENATTKPYGCGVKYGS